MESRSNARLTKPAPGACATFGTGDRRPLASITGSRLSPITDTLAGRYGSFALSAGVSDTATTDGV